MDHQKIYAYLRVSPWIFSKHVPVALNISRQTLFFIREGLTYYFTESTKDLFWFVITTPDLWYWDYHCLYLFLDTPVLRGAVSGKLWDPTKGTSSQKQHRNLHEACFDWGVIPADPSQQNQAADYPHPWGSLSDRGGIYSPQERGNGNIRSQSDFAD